MYISNFIYKRESFFLSQFIFFPSTLSLSPSLSLSLSYTLTYLLKKKENFFYIYFYLFFFYDFLSLSACLSCFPDNFMYNNIFYEFDIQFT